jgi:hypothetical protein
VSLIDQPAEISIGDFLDRNAVAEALGVSVLTLRELERRGEGPPVIRISDRIARYPRAGLVDYLARRTVGEVVR